MMLMIVSLSHDRSGAQRAVLCGIECLLQTLLMEQMRTRRDTCVADRQSTVAY